VLDAAGITVTFGGVRAVNDVSLRVGKSELVGLVGPNGSGKSTLLSAFLGVAPASGHLEVAGQVVPFERPHRSRRAGVACVLQSPSVFGGLTVAENLLVASDDRRGRGLGAALLTRRSMWKRERQRWCAAIKALQWVGLNGLADQPARLLTYVQQRLLDFARAVFAKPQVLLLDEPSAGLNDAETGNLAELIEGLDRSSMGIVLVDHKLPFVNRLCERIVVLDTGTKIADGPKSAVWQDRSVVDAYLGAPQDA
jgi:ABC-type branched-subunit amino acid transport system ATPase component